MALSFVDLLSAIVNALSKLLGKKSTQPPQEPVPPAVPADNATEPAQIVTRKVLLVVYDPVMDATTGKKLSQQQGWNRSEDLVNAFMADVLQVSGGMARYQIVERKELDEFPAKVDDFRYTPATYLEALRGAAPPHTPQEVNYQAILERFNVLPRVANKTIDEVWIFAFPYAGLYESVMGGAGAFWCNAPALKNTSQCPRRFIVMGFNFERGVGEMLESFGHRAESLMYKAFERTTGNANLWARFTRHEKVAPGQAEVGTIHFAPNSEQDYDWNNQRSVPSNCYDWYNFPNFRGDVRQVNASEWGNGDIRAHHLWWLKHLPKVAGRTSGTHNNWWQYIMDANRVSV